MVEIGFNKRYEQWKRTDLLAVASETMPEQIDRRKALESLQKLHCEFVENLGRQDSSSRTLFHERASAITILNETHNTYEKSEDCAAAELQLETAEPNLRTLGPDDENMELSVAETSSTNDAQENFMEPNLESVDPYVAEATDTYEDLDSTFDLTSTNQESLNMKFLRALKRTRSMWEDDKQFAKIVQKMEKGKNLKRKEFDKVHLYIREYCQYH